MRASMQFTSKYLLSIFFVTLLSKGSYSYACTTFLKTDKNQVFFGKSYDWDMGQGLVFVNKRGVEKRSLLLDNSLVPAKWTSRYASLTFNQYGREFPNGGMNEAGLGVEISILGNSEFPTTTNNKAMNELQWIQYQLDNYSTVSEMVAHASEITIVPIHGDVHFMACDKLTQCAVFEYHDKKLEVVSGAEVKTTVLANSPYKLSLGNLSSYVGFGGNKPIPEDARSLSRFIRASSLLRKTPQSVAGGFEILGSVASPTTNKWQIIYDLNTTEVNFRTAEHPEIKTLNLSTLDKSCKTPVMYVDMQVAASGDITPLLSEYRPMENAALVRKSYSKTFSNYPKAQLEQIIKLASDTPLNYSCAYNIDTFAQGKQREK